MDALNSARVPVHGLPRGNRLRMLLIVNGISVVVLVAGAVVAVPYVAAAIARRIPLSVEQDLGGRIDALFDKDYCDSAGTRKVMRTLQSRIEGPSALPRDLRVLDVSMPNAFTFPGGRIVVTRGLLREAESPDELAGVVAHDMQHAEQRHIMAHIIRSAISSAGWAVTVGDFTGILVVDPSTAFQIANLHFSRADEESADLGAVTMLDRAKIPRDGFVRFFDRLKAKSDVVPEWLSSHPTSARRAREVAQTGTGAVPIPPQPVLSPTDWQTLKDACSDRPTETGKSLRQILFGD